MLQIITNLWSQARKGPRGPVAVGDHKFMVPDEEGTSSREENGREGVQVRWLARACRSPSVGRAPR